VDPRRSFRRDAKPSAPSASPRHASKIESHHHATDRPNRRTPRDGDCHRAKVAIETIASGPSKPAGLSSGQRLPSLPSPQTIIGRPLSTLSPPVRHRDFATTTGGRGALVGTSWSKPSAALPGPRRSNETRYAGGPPWVRRCLSRLVLERWGLLSRNPRVGWVNPFSPMLGLGICARVPIR